MIREGTLLSRLPRGNSELLDDVQGCRGRVAAGETSVTLAHPSTAGDCGCRRAGTIPRKGGAKQGRDQQRFDILGLVENLVDIIDL